jgi:sterol desaturase/sphingolipid hydroxylase (fatty acid hydroxylase superfamily)
MIFTQQTVDFRKDVEYALIDLLVMVRRDNLVILQTLIAAMVANSPAFPGVAELRTWDPRGWALALLLHVTVSEPAFYWAHRALHRAPLFSQYHAKHHSSPVTQPFTGILITFPR